MINLNCSPDDLSIIFKIADRALTRIQSDKLTIGMCLIACHRNGNPLDLERLLNAEDFDFFHDVSGILHHTDRKTGKLEGFFVPRFSK